ncbi:MAG TPA: hypothetical protein VJU78_19600 [Chitinophagaceae bacterium]|nr:hypothetical protein [Chitinophagaceae bacterium]
MKNLVNGDSKTPANFTSISLQLLLNDLLSNLPEAIALNKIVIANEISSEFKTLADQSQVVPVIDELLTTVITNARNTCICITAEKFIDIITLSIEDRNNYNGYALSFSLMAIEQRARVIGGDITIQGAQKRVATVSFSFPDTLARKQYTC